MASGIKYKNFFKVRRFIAQNSITLWQILLQNFKDIKSFICLPKYGVLFLKKKKLWGLKHGTRE